jgi:hypothetical protein
VGPSRGEWRRAMLAAADRLFVSLPPSIKGRRHIGAPIDRRDPTEAVRSSEILAAVSRHFQIEERRDYGGNFLAVIHPHLRLDRLAPRERDDVLQSIIQAETEHLRSGAASYYTVLLATPLEGVPFPVSAGTHGAGSKRDVGQGNHEAAADLERRRLEGG